MGQPDKVYHAASTLTLPITGCSCSQNLSSTDSLVHRLSRSPTLCCYASAPLCSIVDVHLVCLLLCLLLVTGTHAHGCQQYPTAAFVVVASNASESCKKVVPLCSCVRCCVQCLEARSCCTGRLFDHLFQATAGGWSVPAAGASASVACLVRAAGCADRRGEAPCLAS